MWYDTNALLHHILGYTPAMTDDTGERDLSAYPKPGTAEIGILTFGPASASGRANPPEPRPALNTEKLPLAKAGPPVEYSPTPTERIADALERIAAALESQTADG